MRIIKNIMEFFKEKGFAILLLSVIFTLGSLFLTSDIVYNHEDLSTIELGWPISFVVQNHSQLDPPTWWFPNRIGMGAPQEYATSFNFFLFNFGVVLNFLIIFSIVFIILKLNPRLLFLRKIVSVKYIVSAVGVALLALISLFVFMHFIRPQIDVGISPPDISPLQQAESSIIKIDIGNQPNQSLNIQDVRVMVPFWPINEDQAQGWKSYTSQKLGIVFKYPPNYLVVEAEETTTPAIGASASIAILENTPHSRQYAKTLNINFDYDIPDGQKNTDIEASSGISLSKSISSGFIQGIAQWFESSFKGIGDRSVNGFANFIGMNSVIYQGEGLFIFDGVIFEREGYLYQFGVQYDHPDESHRIDFYKIISTIEFL